ncbi:rhomboid family intramembrane serine protease [Porphyromonadaceae bacterium W3.11]|nr:rhomboid family intramembrane serine protease [Porphyromonadaceae bacterium W3.11]
MRIGAESRIPTVTLNLLIINLIVWVAQSILPRVGIDFTNLFGMHYFGAKSFGVWQMISYMFLHAPGLGHIFSNMFALFMFGPVLERIWGSKRFLIFYLVTGVGAGLVQQLVWFISTPPEVLMYYSDLLLTIGASGAIFGILLAFGMIFPDIPLFILFVPVPIKAKWFVIFYGLFELFSGVASLGGSNIAHFAHLGGMLFGFLMIKYWQKKDKKQSVNGWQDFY